MWHKQAPTWHATHGGGTLCPVCVPGPVFSCWSRGHDNRVKCPLIWSPRLRVTFLFRLPLPVAICLQGARRLQERTQFKFSAKKRWLTMLTAVQSGQVIVQHVLSVPSSHNFPIKIIFSIYSITIITQREKLIVFNLNDGKQFTSRFQRWRHFWEWSF